MITDLLSSVDVNAWITDQVVGLDWYDGPRCGFCRLKYPEVDFYFELVAERSTPDGLDDRLFSVAIIAKETFNEVMASLAFAGDPVKPVWLPRWYSPKQTDLEHADKVIEHAIKTATITTIVIRTSDFNNFLGAWNIGQHVNALSPTNELFVLLNI